MWSLFLTLWLISVLLKVRKGLFSIRVLCSLSGAFNTVAHNVFLYAVFPLFLRLVFSCFSVSLAISSLLLLSPSPPLFLKLWVVVIAHDLHTRETSYIFTIVADDSLTRYTDRLPKLCPTFASARWACFPTLASPQFNVFSTVLFTWFQLLNQRFSVAASP